MSNNPTTSIPLTDETVDVIAGRVTTFSVGDNVASVKVLQGVENGNVTANPDGTLAVVMSDSDYTGPASFIYQVEYADGRIETSRADLNLVKGVQEAGWGLGDFMLLETDENDRTVVEHGDKHRKVHISGSEDALSRADIAAREGLAESKITDYWLRDHPEYGATPEMALDEEAGKDLWKMISDSGWNGNNSTSNWLLFEKGYEYSTSGIVSDRSKGESAFHPVMVTSYGDGDEAVLNGAYIVANGPLSNIVIRDININGGINATGHHPKEGEGPLIMSENVLLDDVHISGGGYTFGSVNGLTMRNGSSIDNIREFSSDTGRVDDDVWNAHPDRAGGLYINNSHGVLIDGYLFDHNGWGEGYDFNLSEDYPQPPSLYSHNVYIQYNASDVTFRDNITMRAASFGVQVRPGGFIEDNVILDNNAGIAFVGGAYENATNPADINEPIGNYTLFTDNIITSAGHRSAAADSGALAWGVSYRGILPTMINNIITHLADPNNPAEQKEKNTSVHQAFATKLHPTGKYDFVSKYYDDTIIYNWVTQHDILTGKQRIPNQNIDGLDKVVLDQTTIQNFAAGLLNQETATIADLANYLRAQTSGALDHVVDADLIIAFFQQGFGLTPDLNHQAVTQRFVPDDLGDGMRWDNRMNWSEDYTPTEGQDIEFAGNWVYYAGAGTNRVGDLDMGSGGRLTTSAGKLTVTGDLTAGENGGGLDIGNAGQVWIGGYNDYDRLDVDIDGGRFANTGLINGQIDMSISGGQALLSTGTGQFDLTTGSRIEITGDGAKVGFDGSQGQVNVLRLMTGSTLAMVADDTGISTIGEFRSGAYGDAVSNPLSGVALGGALELDLSAYAGGNLTLVQADEIIGSFEDVTVTGLSATQNATLITDYDADTVTVKLSSGTGVVSEQTIGAAPSQSNTDQVLWDALNEEYLSRVVRSDRADGNQNVDVYVNGVLKTATIVDITNSGNWATYEHHYTPDRKLEKLVATVDDGVVTTYHNQDGVRRAIESNDVTDVRGDWDYAYSSFAANGEKVEDYRLYDDLREENTQYINGIRSGQQVVDGGDAHAWTSVKQQYDADGVLAGKATLYDSSLFKLELFIDGKLALRAELDQADEFVWQARAWSYDSTGKTAEYSEFSDEGQMNTTEYATNDPRDTLLDLYDAFQFENGQFVANVDDPFAMAM